MRISAKLNWHHPMVFSGAAWPLLSMMINACGAGNGNLGSANREDARASMAETGTQQFALGSCKVGFIRECESNDLGKPVCTCERDPNYVAPVTGTVTPSFLITHVYYAVPGTSSSMNYTSGDTLGSSTSATSSFKTENKVTASATGSFLGTASVGITAGDTWASSQTDVTDIAVTNTNGYKYPGYSDDINHNDDQIWFVVNPELEVSFTRASPSAPEQVNWNFMSAGQEYYVYVSELKPGGDMPAGVKRFLNNHGITEDFYPQLLAADPFAYGAPANPAMDPARFEYQDQLAYEPPPTPKASNTQTYAETRTKTNTSSSQSDLSYSVGYTVTGGADFGTLLKVALSDAYTMTWTHSSSHKLSTGSSTGETITVGQPGYGYMGPTVLRIYLDKVWKTYFFTLDWY